MSRKQVTETRKRYGRATFQPPVTAKQIQNAQITKHTQPRHIHICGQHYVAEA